MNDDQTTALSSSGAARRDAMLTELLGHMTTVHRRRHRRHRAAAAFGLLLAVAAVAWIQPLRPAPVGSTATALLADSVSPHAPALAQIVIVATDTSVVARLRAEPSPLVRVVDDETLLATLVEFERPAGLIVKAGSVRLSAAVTDDDLGLDHSFEVPGTG